MTNTEPNDPKRGRRDFGTFIILVALALTGLIPWIGVLQGERPAFSAGAGAVVFLVAVFLLVPTVWELRKPPSDPS